MKIGVLNIGLETVILRYYLMMLVVIAGGFLGSWLIALLALPIFLSAILGISFQFNKKEETKNKVKPLTLPKKQNVAWLNTDFN